MSLKAKGKRQKAKGKNRRALRALNVSALLPFAFCLLPSASAACLLPFAFTVAPSQTSQQPGQTPSPTPTAATADGEAVERIEADATNVLLTATDKKRRFVTTLKPEDLRVLEDGVPQQISYFERET